MKNRLHPISDEDGYDDGMTSPGFHHRGRRATREPRDIPGFGFGELCLNADNRGFANLALDRHGIGKPAAKQSVDTARSRRIKHKEHKGHKELFVRV